MGRLEAGSAERPLRVADQKPVAKLQEDVLKVKQNWLTELYSTSSDPFPAPSK